MRQELLNYICSPVTCADLKLVIDKSEGEEIIEGKLVDEAGKATFPIIKGIPRFIDLKCGLSANYSSSFGHQWLAFNWLRQEDLWEFESIIDRPVSSFKDKAVLDAGCGGGRVARFLAPHSLLYIGVDYSVACEKAYELCRKFKQAHFIQADLNSLPFKKEGVFDFIFSHGVLHHTPNTKKTFLNLPRLVKAGGDLYIAVFRKTFYPFRIVDAMMRTVINKLPRSAQENICQGMVGLQKLPHPGFWKRFFWFSMQKDPEVAKCCNFDWYAPKYHNEHTVSEVMGWFRESGFEDIRYINAWPYCPSKEKYRIPAFKDSFRLGQLIGMLGKKSNG
jgi:SAM-dependent methyltransferase